MGKGTNKGDQGKASNSASKAVAAVGNVSSIPIITGYSSKARKLGDGSKSKEVSYERTSRTKHEDKKSGSYERYTTKETISSGKLYGPKGGGQVGSKNEFKRSSTTKVGDKRGYTEYYREERIRNVSLDNGNSYNSGNNNNCLDYDDDDHNVDYNDDDRCYSSDPNEDDTNGYDPGCNDEGYESDPNDDNSCEPECNDDESDCNDDSCESDCNDDECDCNDDESNGNDDSCDSDYGEDYNSDSDY